MIYTISNKYNIIFTIKNEKVKTLPDIFNSLNKEYKESYEEKKKKTTEQNILKQLNIQCENLEIIPNTICQLTNLDILLIDCNKLDTIQSFKPQSDTNPQNGCLNNLSTLTLKSERLIKIPETIDKLTNLQTLNLIGCTSLTALPETIDKLTNLQTLNIIGCTSLTALPETIDKLTNLQTLNLTGCTSLTTLPTNFTNLTQLKSLNLTGCTSLTTLPTNFTNLTQLEILNLTGCTSLTTLPTNFTNLTQLKSLNLTNCTNLTTLPTNITNLRNIQLIIIDGCNNTLINQFNILKFLDKILSITIIKKHIYSLIDNNTNNVKTTEDKFNKTVNYLFDIFNLSKQIPDALINEQDIGLNANEFLINLISINYKAYIKNKKNLLEQQQPQQLKFIALHGTVDTNTNNIIVFKLPSNITIIFAARISYTNIAKQDGLLVCKEIFKNNSKSSIKNYIDYLNNQQTSKLDGSIGIFKDAIIYYGDQFCTNLILKCSNTDISKLNLGIYDSKCSKVDVVTKEYDTTLQQLINDKYKDTNTNYTLIITSCRPISNINTQNITYNSDPNLDTTKKAITYKNTLKFYEELIQAVNNYDATKNVIKLKSIVNARKVEQIDVKQSQDFNTTKYTNEDRLFPDLTSKKITENTHILYINTDDGNAALITPNQLHNELLSIKSETDIKLFNKFKIKLNKILRLPDEKEINKGYNYIYTYNKQYKKILDIIFEGKEQELKDFNSYAKEYKAKKQLIQNNKTNNEYTLTTEDNIKKFFSYDDNNAIDIQKLVSFEVYQVITINNNKLTVLPDEFNLLENIWQLKLMCKNLVLIPNSIFTIKSLQAFTMCSTTLTTLPLNFTSLINLHFIRLSECTSLKELPVDIGNLTNLKTLDLSKCTSLVALPETICNLKKLETLDISGCTILKTSSTTQTIITNLKHNTPTIKITK